MTGSFTFPLSHDWHNHPTQYAAFAGCPSLAGLEPAQARAVLCGLEGAPALVFGWHSARLPLDARDLATLPPAVILDQSLHGYRLTEAAVPLLAARHPELAAHQGDPVWIERNLPGLFGTFAAIAGLTPAKLDGFMAHQATLGVGLLDDLAVAGPGALAVVLASPWAARIRPWVTGEVFEALDPRARAAVTGLKCFTDGALGARSAALSGGFSDGRLGVLIHRDAELEAHLATLAGFGKPVAIHAIGDLAVAQALGALERLDRAGLRFPAVRLEHVQFIDLPLARRARDLGAVLSMQPNFNTDSLDYADRLTPAQAEANNPFRMLIDEVGFQPGRDLLFGTDGMPHGIACALQASLFPPRPGQRLTLEEVMAGYGAGPDAGGSCTVTVHPEGRRVEVRVGS